ncbi:MAG TPA: response regulator, partial [Gemmataceae bacterium]|nr:response regulator [Gemmataceae bacterium]
DMDGFELAEEMQRQPELAGAAVMMLTSADRQGDAARCRDLGIAAYLIKPFKPSELLDAIVSALGAGNGESDPRHGPMPDGDVPILAPPLRVLVADDHPVNQTLLRCLLARQGHTVVLASNGREAVDFFKAQPFDVVLMDVSMPEMDGFEATARIRQHDAETGRHTPIIAMTAHAMKGDRERCLDAGMDAYLAKPLAASELWRALARVGEKGSRGVEEHWSTKTERSAPPVSSAGSCAINRQAALACVGGDVKLLRALADLFHVEGPRLRDEIGQAIRQKDAPLLRRLAHTLKSAAGNLGGTEVAAVALDLEQIGRNTHDSGSGDLDEAHAAFARLEEGLARMDAELNELFRER